jgi:hypothetical protein
MVDEVLERVRRIEDRVMEIHTFMGGAHEWRASVDERLGKHEEAIDGVKNWKAKLIGAYMAAALLAGVGFQVIFSLLK